MDPSFYMKSIYVGSGSAQVKAQKDFRSHSERGRFGRSVDVRKASLGCWTFTNSQFFASKLLGSMNNREKV